jgi:hypothetical protein
LKALAFPGLGRRVVNFENAQAVSEWIAVRIGIQSCTEDHNLTDTTLKRCSQGIFSEACPDRDKESHPACGWVISGLASDDSRVRPKDAQRKRIGEDPTLLQHLMSGTVKGCGKCGLAWFT